MELKYLWVWGHNVKTFGSALRGNDTADVVNPQSMDTAPSHGQVFAAFCSHFVSVGLCDNERWQKQLTQISLASPHGARSIPKLGAHCLGLVKQTPRDRTEPL